MTVKRDQTTFRVPLTDAFHQAAQGFYHHHSEPQKRKRVYLNTLSVQAAQFYLTCLGIETSLEKSESWNPTLQVLADTADLWVGNLGRLECRPVLPDSSTVDIPSEAWADRIGYLFVQVDPALTEATLLGFLPQPEAASVPLGQLQSLETFPEYLEQLRHCLSVSSAPRVTLQHWLAQIVDASWTNLDKLIAEWQGQDRAFSFRTPAAKTGLIEPATAGVKQGKFLTLSKVSEERVLFIVGIMPAQKQSAFNITVEVYPAGNQAYLPATLQMVVMDEANTPVLQAEGRQSEGLEFHFSGGAGERFSVQITFNQFTVTERFEI
ncbi:MAG: DUF1822 family protein [Leptolyngbya sp. SIO1E4]|nr:DUF1822 family protein [Leptolyngbya sp. SIO1E4]